MRYAACLPDAALGRGGSTGRWCRAAQCRPRAWSAWRGCRVEWLASVSVAARSLAVAPLVLIDALGAVLRRGTTGPARSTSRIRRPDRASKPGCPIAMLHRPLLRQAGLPELACAGAPAARAALHQRGRIPGRQAGMGGGRTGPRDGRNAGLEDTARSRASAHLDRRACAAACNDAPQRCSDARRSSVRHAMRNINGARLLQMQPRGRAPPERWQGRPRR
jgi:hypothetical protein